MKQYAEILKFTHIPDVNNQADNETDNEADNEEDNQPDTHLNSETCVICQEPLEEGCIMRKIKKCNHSFHMHCLDIWLERKITYPTCRADIREDNSLEDANNTNEESNLDSEADVERSSRTI